MNNFIHDGQTARPRLARMLASIGIFVAFLFVITLAVIPARSQSGATSTPTSGQIAFTSRRDGHAQIYLMNPDGSNQTNISRNNFNDSHPAWSSDGTQLAFVSERDGNGEICVMNADGSNQHCVTNEATADKKPNPKLPQDYEPTWSPDGQHIAFVSNRSGKADIWAINVDGSNPVNLTQGVGNNDQPAWSPNQRVIAFVSDRSGNTEICVMDASGFNQRCVTAERTPNKKPDKTRPMDSHPAWSPDGQRIAFVSTRERSRNRQVFVMNADGSDPVDITKKISSDDQPAWSPDGKTLAFTSNRDGLIVDIYSMASDGSLQTRLTQTTKGGDFEPAYALPALPLSAPETPTPTGTILFTAVPSDTPTPTSVVIYVPGVINTPVPTPTNTPTPNKPPPPSPLVRPTVRKAFAPNPIAAGGTSTLTITLSNANGVALTGAAFTDTYPSGLTNSATPGGATTCGGTVTAAANGGSVALSGGTIPANGSCTVTVQVTASAAGSYVNTIPAGGVTTANGGSNTTPATATLTVLGLPTVRKAFAPNPIAAGGTSTLTITLSNANGVALTGAAFTDTYPSGLTNSAKPGGATTCGGTVTAAANGGSVALSGGTIPANGSCTVTVQVTASAAGSYVNTIPAGGVTTANGGSNIAPGTGTLSVLAPPTVSKSFTPNFIDFVTVNSASLTITLSNPNGVALTGAAFTDTYPCVGNACIANLTPLSATTTCAGGVVTATANGGSVALSGGTIPANGSCTVTVQVTASCGLTNGVVNTIPAGGVTTANSGSNTAPASATLTTAACGARKPPQDIKPTPGVKPPAG